MKPPAHVKRLRELLADLAEVPGAQDREIRGLSSDSREVVPGDLFLALPGLRADGREFIHDVIARGATAVAYEDDARPVPRDVKVPVIPVADLRLRAGVIA
ncbi:MAG: Mur ligase domain-containing protein, partial [Pseudomonadota bacterium]